MAIDRPCAVVETFFHPLHELAAEFRLGQPTANDHQAGVEHAHQIRDPITEYEALLLEKLDSERVAVLRKRAELEGLFLDGSGILVEFMKLPLRLLQLDPKPSAQSHQRNPCLKATFQPAGAIRQ